MIQSNSQRRNTVIRKEGIGKAEKWKKIKDTPEKGIANSCDVITTEQGTKINAQILFLTRLKTDLAEIGITPEKNYDGQTNSGDCWRGRDGGRERRVLVGQHCLEAERYLQADHYDIRPQYASRNQILRGP